MVRRMYPWGTKLKGHYYDRQCTADKRTSSIIMPSSEYPKLSTQSQGIIPKLQLVFCWINRERRWHYPRPVRPPHQSPSLWPVYHVQQLHRSWVSREPKHTWNGLTVDEEAIARSSAVYQLLESKSLQEQYPCVRIKILPHNRLTRTRL